MPDSLPDIPFDGERLTADAYGPIVSEHMHRYMIANSFTNGKDVLDIACGEGYGSYYLSAQAKSVIGVDISADAIAYAQTKYQQANLKFLEGNCTAIPVPEHSVDVVVSFETLEHILEHSIFLNEIKRVLRHDGILVISTPDKKNYSEQRNFKNPFHVNELYHTQFRALIKKYFKKAYFGKQIHQNGSVVEFYPPSELMTATGDYTNVDRKKVRSVGAYCMAVASDFATNRPVSSIFQFRTDTPQAISRYARCEVFVSRDGNYSADKSEAFNIRLGQKTALCFKGLQKHASQGKVYLRIDPLDRIGTFELIRLTLYFKDASGSVEHRREIMLTKEIVSTLGCLKVRDNVERYVAIDDDPQLSVSPFEWDGVIDWWLELEIDTSPQIHDVATYNQGQIAYIGELQSAVDQNIHAIAERDNALAVLRDSQTKLSARVEKLQSDLDAAIKRNEVRLASECECHAKELENIKRELGNLLVEMQKVLLAEKGCPQKKNANPKN